MRAGETDQIFEAMIYCRSRHYLDESPQSLEKKPASPLSNWAIMVCIYGEQVVDIVANLTPSARRELEITDVNREHLQQGSLSAGMMREAAEFVRTLERRQSFKIACPEEIA